jgi:BirA family transcriptional regulator, biotin operon repressor / biotin---[acetyl-CoA-carboxylase] ligase
MGISPITRSCKIAGIVFVAVIFMAKNLSEAEIHSFIQNEQAFTLEVQTSLDSSHQELKRRLLSSTLSFPHILLVEQQTQGIGQANKNWHSPFAENIYLSCAWAFSQELSSLQGLSLTVGLAIIDALHVFLGKDQNIRIKWPNDIFYENKKMGGILVDIEHHNTENIHAIISIGLNVNMTVSGESINQPWNSLCLIKKRIWDRNQVAGVLINSLFNYLLQFSSHGFSSFLEQWRHYDYLLQKSITLKNAHGSQMGIASGVDIHGRLLHLTADGKITAYTSAEIIV